MARIYNFCSGPAALPLPVLEKAQAELTDFQKSGMSVMEMSHRGKIFDEVIQKAEANVRKLMSVTDDYSVLFLQGGASQQFAIIPLNLMTQGGFAEYIDTGYWADRAIKEAKVIGKVQIPWSGKDANYLQAPNLKDIVFDSKADYAYICPNETISGLRWPELPVDCPTHLCADMSSYIMSEQINVKRFGLIFAGAQKNLGPSGLALVIIRKDLAERASETVPIFFRYRTHMKEPSLYNTPNTWAVYLLQLVTDWLLEQGGIPAMKIINERKAKALYDALDASNFWKPCVQGEARSRMNITWRMATEELEEEFVKTAKSAGFDGLKGHRSVGGIRASIYNAFPEQGVRDLIAFMKEFERKKG